MTRTIPLITATVGAALLFAVPAYGDNWGADKAQPTTDAVVRLPDAHDIVRDESNGYADAAERAQRIDVVVPTAMTDAFERSAPPVGSRVEPVSGAVESGFQLDLPQLGIGLGLGLALALGLYFAMRLTRTSPVAH